MAGRNDPRLGAYFDTTVNDLSAERQDPTFPQPVVTAAENHLIWAESAFRTGDAATALAQVNAERALVGLPAVSASGPDLLRAILDEKYVAEYQNLEVWNDYKRTCYPNLTPVVPGGKIPARLLYDTNERQTNTSIPDPSAQPARNPNDPPNATDPFGAPCLGQ